MFATNFNQLKYKWPVIANVMQAFIFATLDVRWAEIGIWIHKSDVSATWNVYH